jgi:hypothetical protein
VAAVDQLESVRAGSRWLYAEPTSDQVKEWFEHQPLHSDMPHSPYLGGIVLIAQEEKVKVTRKNASDQMFIEEQERATFTPYVKVDTRIAYFWDYVDVLNEQDGPDSYFGLIEPVPQTQISDPNSAFFNAYLPEGFGWYAVKQGNDSIRRFIVATFECAIYERQSYVDRLNGKPALPILKGRGTKQVQANYKGRDAWADDSALMKAETGAIGRALGVAGILVVGTGVATAEDVQEAVSTTQGAPGGGTSAGPALPPVVDREGQPVDEAAIKAEDTAEAPQEAAQSAEAGQEAEPTDEELRERATALRAELEQASPEAWAAYVHWYTEERQFPALDQLTGSALKGAVVKLERSLDEARGGGA